jgi:hypothetical protein
MGADRPTPSFSRKRIDEDLKLSFDFTNDLASAETISTQTVTATVYSGTDANAQDIVSGSASASGQIVTQLIINGLEGVTYLLECEITTDQAQKVHLVGLLPVSDTESA